MIKEYDQLIKLILVGSTGVGKSSVLCQFADNKFNEGYFTTIGVDFRFKTLSIDNQSVKFQIWDTAGQERFRTITSAYYKGADGVIIVYDITEPQTFEDVDGVWGSEIRSYADENVPVLLLGNKCDCERKVNLEMAKGYATEKGYDFDEVSAKTAEGVQRSIRTFGKKVADRKSNKDKSKKAESKTSSQILHQVKSSASTQKSQCC